MTSEPSSRRPSSPFPLGPFLVPATLLLLALAVYPAVSAITALGFPFQIDREEGFLLNQALCLSRGQTIYPALTHYPYTVGNYPPVYPAVYSVLVWLFGTSLAAGRLINQAAALAMFVGMGWSIRKRTGRWVAALLAPGLVAVTWDFNQWIAFARVDLLALSLTVWGFVVFIARRERGGGWGAAVLFSLALLTRQTMVAAPLAALATLALDRNWRGLRNLAVRLVLLAGGAYGILFLVTWGEAWRHLVTYNANPFHWEQVQVWAHHLWRFQKFLIALAGMTAICLIYMENWERWRVRAAADSQDEERQSRRSGDTEDSTDEKGAEQGAGAQNETDRASAAETDATASAVAGSRELFLSRPDALYMIFAFGAFFLVGKEGAASNYLLEFHAALALFLGLHVGKVCVLESRGFRHHALGLLNVLLFLGISFHAVHAMYLRNLLFSEVPPGAPQLLAGMEVVESLQGDRGEVISEEPIYALLTGHEVLYQPFIMRELARQGLWDPGPFLKDLRAGKFSAIVTTQNVFDDNQYFIGWTPEMRKAMREAYRLDEFIDHGPRWRYWVLRPKATARGGE